MGEFDPSLNFTAALSPAYNHSDYDDYTNRNRTGTGIDENVALIYHYLWTVATPVIFGIITVIGVIGNCLVIHVITSRKSMRTVTNLLLLNLAVADLTLIIVCVPPTAVKYVIYGWPFGEAFCKIINYVQYVSIYVTIYTLVVISVYRFITVVCYGRFQWLRTRRTALVVIVCIWITMLAANVPILFIHRVKISMGFVYCGMVRRQNGEHLHITFFVFAYVLPLTFILILYLLILHFLKSTRTSTIDQNHAKERAAHARKIVTMVVVAFGVSWLPLQIHFMVAYFGTIPSGPVYEVFRILWHCMQYGNSCVNPIIYNYVSAEFRKAFKETMCGCFCCRKLQQQQQQQQQTMNNRGQSLKTQQMDSTLPQHGNNGNGPTELTIMIQKNNV